MLKLGFVGFLLIWNDSKSQTVRDDLLKINSGLLPLNDSTILPPGSQFMALLERSDNKEGQKNVTVRSCFRIFDSKQNAGAKSGSEVNAVSVNVEKTRVGFTVEVVGKKKAQLKFSLAGSLNL